MYTALARRFISVRQQCTIQLLAERGSVSLESVHQVAGTGSVRVRQLIVQQSEDDADLDDVQITLSRMSTNECSAICGRLEAMSGVRECRRGKLGRETVMTRSYDYEGFTLEISVESGISIGPKTLEPIRTGYVAVVRIFQAASTLAVFSPLRFGESRGRPFATEADALMGGYSAARKIVDDLFSHEGH